MNVSVGAYRQDNGKPWVLPSVLKAEERVMAAGMNKEYAPIHGVDDFVKLARGFALGASSPALQDERVASVQSLSGTGACRVIGARSRRATAQRRPALAAELTHAVPPHASRPPRRRVLHQVPRAGRAHLPPQPLMGQPR